ncbi:uncharacterized protein K02A2.6-like [Dreissena polymorpha]|uniref:uncharacterized protein K02A2.6-like n=1 Tax=Dreissena polymorpha TaxID=45954 RepID=UPI002264156F|nr:uncharacterized protein K02A2.6-like [Dreissena polymorpha]
MVVLCDYCRFPIVELIRNISAHTVISRLETIFAMLGIPSIVKSDNGAPLNSQNFTEFANRYGFQHRRVTPLHPQANGLVEAFIKPLVKALKTAGTEGIQIRQGLSNFLMNNRSTPHPSTGRSPAEIMFGRKLKTKIPIFGAPENDKHVQ